ncbi:hypothetical protein [Amycolatopsis thermoflava]|uniref:hypothetical protein n=1 Tax=Amycolatopsis thermoflava TaxID=84480 RepID=UPI003F49FF99
MEKTPQLRPLPPTEPVGRSLDVNRVLLALALAEFDCAPDEKPGLQRGQAEVRRLAGIPDAHPA